MWNGKFVADALSIEIPASQPELTNLLGMALRKNKKRAHLLVSTVLGKHIPVAPIRAIEAANNMADQITAQVPKEQKFTVFGYAETATCLGANVANRLMESHDVFYIHSTRYPVQGSKEYGSFEESHSHATSHHITPFDVQILDDSDRSIVLVDDELTTGNTVMNTIRLFESRAHHDTYFIATLTDMRTEDSLTMFRAFEEEMGISVHVVSLLATHLVIPEGSVEKAAPIIEHLKSLSETSRRANGIVSSSEHLYNLPSLSLGAGSEGFERMRRYAAAIASEIPLDGQQRVLVLGLEENMFFQMLVAHEINRLGHAADFSSTTRSPVITYNDASYAIKTRIRYEVEDDVEPRYAYNIHKEDYDTVLLISDSVELKRSHALIEELVKEFNNVHLSVLLEAKDQPVKMPTLAEPLTGEKGFSSYSGTDVLWLLKDISAANLEAPTEEREEAVQAGRSHYSESLPVEYLASDEYQQLFVQSLHLNKEKIAEAVGLVAERIREVRSSPVLVSLARGGTPVGALIKRYLKTAYNMDTPHYAVSIMRGRGLDFNALRYITSHHSASDIIFVDGWTGKGAITNELKKSLNDFYILTGIEVSDDLAVLADPGSCTKIYGTREDYLIPSACLNSTVSGLVSRTVLNYDLIDEHDYHGAKFYEHFAAHDMSNMFLDEITAEFSSDLVAYCSAMNASRTAEAPDWSGWKTVTGLKEEFEVSNMNLIKPGVGETTRVLLRRTPWVVLINPNKKQHLQHILLLAQERGVQIIERPDLPYSCVGIIKSTN